MRNLVLTGGVAGKATYFTHNPLASKPHHKGGAVRALDRVAK